MLKRPAQRYGMSLSTVLLCVGALSACASGPRKAPNRVDFSGGWAIEWCDHTNPTLDCGGFSVTLVQEGNRICGDFGGALVNLRQIDEGGVVGTVVGDTAVLAVQSSRNGSISLVRAEHHGTALNWRVVDEIRRRENADIDVIANNDVLERQPRRGRPSSRSCAQSSDAAGGA